MNDQLIPDVIPPGSIVKLVKADKSTPEWLEIIGTVFRIGYYSPQDGLETIWLVDSDGNYSQTVDYDGILRYFEVIKLSKRKDFYGLRSKPLGPITLAGKKADKVNANRFITRSRVV